MECSGILLAGGRSRRMGTDKRLVHVNGQPLFERALSTFERVFHEILVIVGATTVTSPDVRHRTIIDEVPNAGPVGALYTGIRAASFSRVFMAACDMPFLNEQVIRRMCVLGQDADVTIARVDHQLHTMQGVYSRACEPVLKRMLDAQTLRLAALASQDDLRVRHVSMDELRDLDPYGLSFMNVNTPADLEMANKLCRTKP